MLATSEDVCAHREAGPSQGAGALTRGVMQHVRNAGHLKRATATGSRPSELLCGASFPDTLTLLAVRSSQGKGG